MKKLFIAAALMLAGFTAQAHSAALEARVDLSEQRMVVLRNGVVQYSWPVSTGRRGYVTPTGSYRAKRLVRMHYSRKYDNAPMPYSIFFRGGYAIHGTDAVKRLGRPASHGCIRLHTDNARTLYGMVKQVGAKNARIVITH